MDHVNTHIANIHGVEPQGPAVSALNTALLHSNASNFLKGTVLGLRWHLVHSIGIVQYRVRTRDIALLILKNMCFYNILSLYWYFALR